MFPWLRGTGSSGTLLCLCSFPFSFLRMTTDSRRWQPSWYHEDKSHRLIWFVTKIAGAWIPGGWHYGATIPALNGLSPEFLLCEKNKSLCSSHYSLNSETWSQVQSELEQHQTYQGSNRDYNTYYLGDFGQVIQILCNLIVFTKQELLWW